MNKILDDGIFILKYLGEYIVNDFKALYTLTPEQEEDIKRQIREEMENDEY